MQFFTDFKQFVTDFRDLMSMLRDGSPINLNVNITLRINGELINPVDGSIVITPAE